MRQLADAITDEEDEADGEHRHDGLLAFLGGGLGEQVERGTARTYAARPCVAQRVPVDGRVARGGARGGLERADRRAAGAPPAARRAGRAEQRRRRGPERAVAVGVLGAQLAAERDQLGEVGDRIDVPNAAMRTSPCA